MKTSELKILRDIYLMLHHLFNIIYLLLIKKYMLIDGKSISRSITYPKKLLMPYCIFNNSIQKCLNL